MKTSSRVLILALLVGFIIYFSLPKKVLSINGCSSQKSEFIYVDINATGPNPDGKSWASAFTNLQDALDVASDNHEIWVADGTYVPEGNNRSASFMIATNVGIYGGFTGVETDCNDRDWETNETILSGNRGNPESSDNSYHVVQIVKSGISPILDGFTVRDGKANGNSGNNRDKGGGIFISEGAPILVNLEISANSAFDGGGLFIDNNAAPLMKNNQFIGNSADNDGGAIYINSGFPMMSNIVIRGNSASVRGGGIFNYANNLLISNCLITGNLANVYGGGIYNKNSNNTEIGNCTIAGNRVFNLGGGIYNENSNTEISNSILWRNKDSSGIGGETSQVFDDFGILTTDISYSIIEGGWSSGIGILDSDPNFTFAINPDDAPSPGGNFHLQDNSPAIDAGYNSLVFFDMADLDNDGITTAEPIPVDFDFQERFWDHIDVTDTGVSTPPTPVVDMGIDENHFIASPTFTPTETLTPCPTFECSTVTPSPTFTPSPSPTTPKPQGKEAFLPLALYNNGPPTPDPCANFFPGPYEHEPNDDYLANANGPICSDKTYYGYSDNDHDHDGDDDDYYYFFVITPMTITINVDDHDVSFGNGQIQLWKLESGGKVFITHEATPPTYVIKYYISPTNLGEFFVRVLTANNDFSEERYSIKIHYK